MYSKAIKPPNPYGVNHTVVEQQNVQEGAHDRALQKFRAFYQGLIVRRVELPHDTPQSQAHRQLQWNRQASMPWGNQYMVIPNEQKRLNNPAQQAFVNQQQLAAPNSYKQFHAFMQAMSAAFGSIKSGQ